MKQYLWSFLHKVTDKGFTTVLALALGNLLLPRDMGLYVAVMMVASYAVATLSLGIHGAIVQKLNDRELADRRGAYFTAGALTVALLSVALLLLLHLLRPPLLQLFDLTAAPSLYTLALPLVFIQVNKNYYVACLQADVEFRRLVTASAVGSATKLATALSLLGLGYGLPGLMMGIYAGEGVALVLLALRAHRKHVFTLSPTTLEAGRDALAFGLIIHLSAVAVFLDKNVDLLLVNYFLGKGDLAVYNYAMRGSLLMLLLGHAVSGVTYPRLTAAFSAGEDGRVKRLYSDAIRIVFTVLSVGSLAALVHLRPLITLVLPAYYLRMVEPFTLLVIAMVLFGAVAAVGSVLTAKGVPQYGALINWGAVLINAVLCLLLIPRYGVTGAALATGATFSVRSVASLVVADRLFETGLRGLRFGVVVLVFAGVAAIVAAPGTGAFAGWALWLAYVALVAAVLWDREDVARFRDQVAALRAGGR